jgi:hypothetical protein
MRARGWRSLSSSSRDRALSRWARLKGNAESASRAQLLLRTRYTRMEPQFVDWSLSEPALLLSLVEYCEGAIDVIFGVVEVR